MKNLASLWELQSWERRVLARQVLVLTVVKLLLRWQGLRGTAAQLGNPQAAKKPLQLPANMRPVDYAQRCAALTGIAARRGPIVANCLPQALALQALLNRYGMASELRIGIRPATNPLDAHAWVELDGVPLGANPPPGYQIIGQLDSDSLHKATATRHTSGNRS